MQKTILKFTLGFVHKNVRFGWNDKKLFRLPFTTHGKQKHYQSLMEIIPKEHNGSYHYRCRQDMLSVGRVHEMTHEVNWEVTTITE